MDIHRALLPIYDMEVIIMSFFNRKPVINQTILATAKANMMAIGMSHDSAIKQEYYRLVANQSSQTDAAYLNRPSTAGRRKG